MIYLQLAWEFFKVGLFAIGGALSALPFLYDIAARFDWFTVAQVADMVAVAECTPGPIAINMATYAGMQAAGPLGSVIATLFLVLPSVLISLLICTILARWAKGPALSYIFGGLRPAVAGLIASIAISMVMLALLGFNGLSAWTQPISCNYPALIFFILLLPAIFLLKKHPILYIALGAVVGIIFQL